MVEPVTRIDSWHHLDTSGTNENTDTTMEAGGTRFRASSFRQQSNMSLSIAYKIEDKVAIDQNVDDNSYKHF
jgi:hypothetical protein